MITSKEKQQKILQEMHNCPFGGHQGVQRTYDRLKLYVTWRGMFHDVEEYITNCKVCQKNKFTGPYIKAPFQETDTVPSMGQALSRYFRCSPDNRSRSQVHS